MHTSVSTCRSSFDVLLSQQQSLLFLKMSDQCKVIPPYLASSSRAAHYSSDSSMTATVADVGEPDRPGHQASLICISSSGGATSTLPLRHVVPPHVTSTLHSKRITEDQVSSSPMEGLETASSSLSMDISRPATLSSSGCAVFQKRNGASLTASASGSTCSLLGTSKTAKRHHKIGNASHTHRRTGATGSLADRRSVSERCKAARTFAAELMSALMEHPPEATEIAQYRALMKTMEPSTPSKRRESTHLDASATSPAAENEVSKASLHCSSGAVLKGVAKTTSLSLLGAKQKAPQAPSNAAVSFPGLTANIATPDDDVSAGERSTSPAAATASKATESVSVHSSARKLLELVPGDTNAIPQLLSVLREIALSCASPDTFVQAAGEPKLLSASSSSSSHNAGSVVVGTTSGSCSEAAPAADTAVHSSADLSAVDEEHWHRVRAHFEVVRRLVLNEHELVNALDETLGAEWRGASASVKEHACEATVLVPSASSTSCSCELPTTSSSNASVSRVPSATASVTPSLAGGDASLISSSTAHVPGGAGLQSASTTDSSAVISLMPTSASSHTSMHLTGSVGATSPASPGTIVSHSAHSPSSCTPLSVDHRPQERGVSCSSKAPSPIAHQRAASSNGATTTSMKQLSENSSSYSPSQHVAMMLDRSTTPPSVSRTQGDGEVGFSNLPSTPLSETAAPYRPSASLIGTSPQGGNSSASISASFRLETREEMLRRRSAAPNAFYASMSHGGATQHYRCGSLSATTTPGAFVPSSLAPGVPPFALGGGTGVVRSMPVSPVVSYTSPLSSLPCPYEYLLVLDFEATCEEHPPPNYLYEIIEFPVVVVDVRLQRIVAEFHRFVRPRYKRDLSPFCKELTGIRQEDVDAAAPLEEVLLQFERWFSQTLPPHARCMFVTDGPMDLREFMYIHSVSRQGIRFPPLFYQFIDVKQVFACFFQCSPGKIKAMLEVLHLPFEGRLHSGLHDSRNIASIVIGLLSYGCSFCEVSVNRLPINGLVMTGGPSANGSGSLVLPPSIAPAAPGRIRTYGTPPASIFPHQSVKEDGFSR